MARGTYTTRSDRTVKAVDKAVKAVAVKAVKAVRRPLKKTCPKNPENKVKINENKVKINVDASSDEGTDEGTDDESKYEINVDAVDALSDSSSDESINDDYAATEVLVEVMNVLSDIQDERHLPKFIGEGQYRVYDKVSNFNFLKFWQIEENEGGLDVEQRFWFSHYVADKVYRRCEEKAKPKTWFAAYFRQLRRMGQVEGGTGRRKGR